ncbi:hypothetical protein DPMN_037209 [Dreissena polymorpha]|uniref:Uncharacterized protein n=1 Tax=Dreissena polymorpha TaxID=45954 RepID=A0A9D4MC84_DREPO|nr:hypothetical protein DPMN_037209 [Dreissena polymorpha]
MGDQFNVGRRMLDRSPPHYYQAQYTFSAQTILAKKEGPFTLEHCQVKDCQLQAVLCECSRGALDWASLRKLFYATATDTLGARTGLMRGH